LSSEEIIKMKNDFVDQKELERAKQHIKGNLLLGLEISSNRMLNLAKQHIYFDSFISTEETIIGIESVTPEDIQTVANDLFKTKHLALAILGNIDKLEIDIDDIKWD
jgi:predicted Zn-dependent peptidase